MGKRNKTLVGSNIERILRSKGWTRKMLADKAGYTQNTISNIITGYENFSQTSIERIASALEVDLYELFLSFSSSGMSSTDGKCELIFEEKQKRIARLLRSSSPLIHDAVLNITKALTNIVEKQQAPMVKRGKNLVAFEGIDGVSISEQLQLIKEKHEDAIVSRIDYETPIGRTIKEFFEHIEVDVRLRGKFQEALLIRYILYGAYRIYRFWNDIIPGLNAEKTVFVEYYSLSGYAYTKSDDRDLELIMDYIRSFDYFMPEPSLTFLLDVSPAKTISRSEKNGFYLPYRNKDYLSRVRKAYLEKAKENKDNAIIVNGVEDCGLLHKKILRELNKRHIM